MIRVEGASREPCEETRKRGESNWLPALVALVLWFLLSGPAPAQRLPITGYSTADGLLSDRVIRVVRDGRGQIWVCHRGGLNRFDGHRFAAYGPERGLPETFVRDVLETRDGDYLVATGEGIYLFDPRGGERLFRPLSADGPEPPAIYDLFEDGQGRVWAATRTGVRRVVIENGVATYEPVFPGGAADTSESPAYEIIEGRGGALWFGTVAGLVRLDADGTLTRYTMEDGLPSDDVRAVLEDHEGFLWAGTTAGLVRLRFEEPGGAVVEALRFLEETPQRARFVEALFESSDGTLWVGSSAGLGEIRPGEEDRPVRWYTAVNGLKQNSISSFAGDPRGDLWIGTQAGGVMRLTLDGFLSYTEAEGLPDARITSIFETRAGDLCATATGGEIYALRDGRFHVIHPNVEAEYFGWGWHQWTLQDREGDWWVPTGEGLYRFDAVRRVEDLGRAAPVARYTMREGLSGDSIFRLYEDSRGDVWIGTISGEVRYQLTRWDRRGGTFQRYGAEPKGSRSTRRPPSATTAGATSGSASTPRGWPATGTAPSRGSRRRTVARPASSARSTSTGRGGCGSRASGAGSREWTTRAHRAPSSSPTPSSRDWPATWSPPSSRTGGAGSISAPIAGSTGSTPRAERSGTTARPRDCPTSSSTRPTGTGRGRSGSAR